MVYLLVDSDMTSMPEAVSGRPGKDAALGVDLRRVEIERLKDELAEHIDTDGTLAGLEQRCGLAGRYREVEERCRQ